MQLENRSRKLIDALVASEASFFSGVPDSTLAAFLAELSSSQDLVHIRATNEAQAIALCVGHHMATGKLGVAYFQNSGLGNAVNPLTSLSNREMFSVPMILVIGWRGGPHGSDTEEHTMMGRILLEMLDLLDVPHRMLTDDVDEEALVKDLVSEARRSSTPVALVVAPGTFHGGRTVPTSSSDQILTRADAIRTVVQGSAANTRFVTTTGFISRELFQYEELRPRTLFLTGSMGSAPAVACGMAKSFDGPIVVLDGDGSCSMHLGNLLTIGAEKCTNLQHIVIDNEAYESTGNQPTHTPTADLAAIAKACGYSASFCCRSFNDLEVVLSSVQQVQGPVFIQVKVGVAVGDPPSRISMSAKENRARFQAAL